MLEQIHFGNVLVGSSFILLVVLLSLGCQRLIKARLGKDQLEACHEVGGYYMAAVGTLYAVILGLAVSEASNQYDEAMHYLETEANGLLQVYYLSATFPEHHQKQIQQSIGRYADEVTQVEWDKMRSGDYSEKAKLILATLMYDIVALEPVTQQQQTTYDRMLESMTEVSASRRGRVLITNYGMQPVEWITLLIGGGITILFTLFFSIENHTAQSLMTAMVAIILSMNLYLVYLFNHPFSGSLAIPPTQFSALKEALKLTETFIHPGPSVR